MSQPWQALERLNDVATSYLSWRLLLGDAFDSHRILLVPIKDLAAALPIPGRPYEWLEIVEVEDGVFEGYNEKTEEYVPIDRRDIVCYEFSFSKLAAELALLVGFEVAFERLGGRCIDTGLVTTGIPMDLVLVVPCQSQRSSPA